MFTYRMTDDVFTEPEEDTDDWVDVRMTNPEEGEWDVDFVVVDGQVNYVDLRIRPALLAGFVDCLIDDMEQDRASQILRTLAEQQDLDLTLETEEH